jgi:hypothetical protein
VPLVDFLNQLWNGILEILSKLIIPDWGALVDLMPIFLVLGVLGPILSILVLVWVIYFVVRPRTGVRYDEGSHPASLDDSGQPIFPAGLPYCMAHALVYPSGATRCEVDQEMLWVRCPMCGLGRSAEVKTCGNCGLVLTVKNRAQVVGPAAGPPPGGAAAA